MAPRSKETLVALAERAYGEPFFAEARHRLSESYRELDRWIATCIRAALSEAPPPQTQVPSDGQTARLVSRIRKLRALAAAHPGRPEAITATSLANDLVTRYDLADCEYEVDGTIDDQMVDKWIQLEKRQVWQRMLAHEVAHFSNVFALSFTKLARMHFFGKHRDVVAAEYVYHVAANSIKKACEEHMREYKKGPHGKDGAAATRRERISFCDSAVLAFGAKLTRIKQEEAATRKGRSGFDRRPRASTRRQRPTRRRRVRARRVEQARRGMEVPVAIATCSTTRTATQRARRSKSTRG